jgi:hypothetical protein
MPWWPRWALAAWWASTTTFVVDELRSVAVGANEMTLGRHLLLWCGHATLVSIVWLTGAASWWIASRVSARARDAQRQGPSSTSRPRVVAATIAALMIAAWPAAWVGGELASGAWISAQWFSGAIVVAPLGIVAVVAWTAFVWLPRQPVRDASPHGRLLVAFAVVLGIADHYVLPGDYPPLHMTLHVVMVAAALVGWARLRADAQALERRWAIVVAAVVVAAPVAWMATPAGARSAIVLRSAVARDWVRRAMPHRSNTLLRDLLVHMDVHAGSLGVDDEGARVPFAGRGEHNVVLVVVDTLRADALPPARPVDGTRFAGAEDTPRLDAWLEGAIRFDRAYSTSTKTHRAMPTMFRSIHAGDDPSTTGVPLALRVQALGLRPAAVVNDWFIASKYPHIRTMMEGFGEDLTVYTKGDTSTAVPEALELVRSFAGDRFFLWVHLYTVHAPGYAGRLLDRADGGPVARYRQSLRYLDGQFAALVDGLAELGHADDTVVVLTSDHGEGLGDHGHMHHGVNVFEEDIAVPLAFAIPGVPGRVVHEPAGTIDVVPTLVDLLGGAPDPRDRGRSLVASFAGEAPASPRPYFFEAPDSGTVGVVVGPDKLIYDPEADVVHRFDVEGDPHERVDLYATDGATDLALLRHLVGYRPALVADELADADVRRRLGERLREVDPRDPGAALPLLVQLAALAEARPLVDRCAEIFDDGGTAVRLLVARHLAQRWPGVFEPRVTAWLQQSKNVVDELALVDALARQGQPEVAVDLVVARLDHYAQRGDASTWPPWLRLVARWRKPPAVADALLTMLRRMEQGRVSASASVQTLVLETAAAMPLPDAGLRPPDGAAPVSEASVQDEILATARELVHAPDAIVRAAALRLVGRHGDRLAIDLARAKLHDGREDLRVRREAMATLAKLAGEDAIDDLAAFADDEGLCAGIVRSLAAIGGPRVVPPLRRIEQTHVHSGIRTLARRAADAIERRRGR